MAETPGSTASMTLRDELPERETPYEHLAVHDVDSVKDYVDPRLNLTSRPSAKELEEGIPRHLAHTLSDHHQHGHDHLSEEKESGTASPDVLYVDWEENDPRDPAHYSRGRKWAITLSACFFTGISAAAASSYAEGFPSMTRDLNCTNFQATIGLSTYPLGFALAPLVTAPLSEEFGRDPLYYGSAFAFAMMHLGVALTKNIQSVLIFRVIAGIVGSTGSTMVGGSIADIWAPHERSLPMAIFSIFAFAGTGFGPVFAGWVEMNPKLEWRWIQWIHFIITGVYFLSLFFTMKETRSGVLLTRLARKLRKETGDNRYRARIEDERGSLRSLILISCTRPIHLLVTEPVVASFSLWIGFGWGVLYSMIEGVTPVFTELHHFNSGTAGTVYVTMIIGSILGFISHWFYQEKIYAEKFKTKGQEARLYSACAAGILFPVGMFIYAWTSFESISWVGNAVGITVFIWAVYVIYLAVFTYLADCYGTFASSALAGQSLCRNLAGTAFPLFSQQMFDRLTFKWASTLFGCLAVLMMPIPFVLFFWGPQIRARSKFASRMLQNQKSTSD